MVHIRSSRVLPTSPGSSRARTTVSNETTRVAAHRMAASGEVVPLNFASAKTKDRATVRAFESTFPASAS